MYVLWENWKCDLLQNGKNTILNEESKILSFQKHVQIILTSEITFHFRLCIFCETKIFVALTFF